MTHSVNTMKQTIYFPTTFTDFDYCISEATCHIIYLTKKSFLKYRSKILYRMVSGVNKLPNVCKSCT